ncbi:MAG: suppressor of fused domain protein [Silicimonas sp.]|nr:suppressor of fused domain protein [Silicimonas sp.]
MDDPSQQSGGKGSGVDLEEVWRQREEEVYPALFGAVSRGIFPLSQDVFAPFGDVKVDPRWITHGVFEFAPTDERPSWLYVTSGYFNPWEDAPEDIAADGPSGAGVEFILETDRQGDWAIRCLQKLLAYELCMASGQVGSGTPLGLNDRIPLGGPITGEAGHTIEAVMIVMPTNVSEGFDLPSGDVMLVQFAGLTDAERAHASNVGVDSLLQHLKATEFPVTVPDRASVV